MLKGITLRWNGCNPVAEFASIVSVAAFVVFMQGGGDAQTAKGRDIPDPEKRLERISDEESEKEFDLSALNGMPAAYRDAAVKYSEKILKAIGAVPLVRKHYYHEHFPGRAVYPLDVNPLYDREIKVKLLLLPRPSVVAQWVESAEEEDCRRLDEAIDKRGALYGRTIVFRSGVQSEAPITTFPLPYEASLSTGLFRGRRLLEFGKLVVCASYDVNGRLEDVTSRLKFGEVGGAEILAEIITVPVCVRNAKLRWVSMIRDGKERRTLAYAIVDGNGPLREKSAEGLTEYTRPLMCARHQPKVDKHYEMLLPTPLRWASTEDEAFETGFRFVPHEDWCLDDWFPAQPNSCWVLRLSRGSAPLCESFSLMAATDASDLPVFLIAMFVDTEPEQLLKELAAIYRRRFDDVLNATDIMQDLRVAYNKLRDAFVVK